MQHKRLGFDKELVVNLPIFFEAPGIRRHYEAVKQAFLAHPNVLKGTAHRYDLGSGRGGAVREVRSKYSGVYEMLEQKGDEDFLETFEIELIAGRNLKKIKD